jgi:hypothetical protein
MVTIDERFLRRVREAGGCTRQCALSTSDSQPFRPAIRFTHNGVSFSRSSDWDKYLAAIMDEQDLVDGLGQWLRAHHEGNQEREVTVTLSEGRTATIMEAVD